FDQMGGESVKNSGEMFRIGNDIHIVSDINTADAAHHTLLLFIGLNEPGCYTHQASAVITTGNHPQNSGMVGFPPGRLPLPGAEYTITGASAEQVVPFRFQRLEDAGFMIRSKLHEFLTPPVNKRHYSRYETPTVDDLSPCRLTWIKNEDCSSASSPQ